MSSQDALETVRRIYDRWSDGDWRAGQEELSDDVVFVVDDPAAGLTTYHGRREVAGYMREFLGAWRRVRQLAAEFIENGDRVFVAARQSGVGKQSGVEAAGDVFAVWTFCDGKVVRLEHLRGRDSALRAAGLEG
jgi:ketosteroid isomerase-like protein